MEKVKRTYKVYSFKELSEDVQEEVIDEFIGINIDFDWWDWIVTEFCQKADELGFEVKPEEVCFDLGRNSHFGVYRKGIQFKTDILKGYTVYCGIEAGVNKIGYFFSDFPIRSWDTTEIRLDIDEVWKGEKEVKPNTKEWEKVEDRLRKKYAEFLELCKKYYGILKDNREYLTSDEAIKDTLEANDYKFLENGRVFS